MPAYKKSSTAKKSTKASTEKKISRTPKAPAKKQPPQRKKPDPNNIVHQILPYIWGLLAFAVAFCLIFTSHSGFIGKVFVRPLLGGLFGIGAFAVPFLILIQAILWRKDIESDTVFFKALSSFFVLLAFSVIIHVITATSDGLNWNPKTLWVNGTEWAGGGLVGGFIANFVEKCW